MDLETIRQLTQNMKQVNENNTDNLNSEEEAAKLFNLAYDYEEGNGVPKDNQKAFELFQKAANLGDINAMFETGAHYYFGKGTPQDTSQAFAWCKKAAEKGQIYAMDWIGECYRDGEGVVQNIQKAIEWFEKSAEGGNGWASLNLGRMYRDGTGVNKDFAKARSWFKKSAKVNDAGSANALIELGDMYSDGIGVEANVRQGIEYYQKAANLGNSFALVRLGDLYLYDERVRNHAKAFEMYKNAAELGNSYGFGGLGSMYYSGCHVEENYSKAVEFFEKAVKLDETNCKALKDLAFCYRCGDGVRKDYSKAFELYKQAAECGDGEAMYKISQMYEFGEGFEQDLNIAEELANRARAMGYNPPTDNGPCFITTAVCENLDKPDDCYELTTFRKFRDEWLTNQPDGKDLIAEYYSIAPQIVNKINSLPNSAQVYKNLLQDYLEPCLAFIEHDDNQACKQLYTEMVTYLKGNYLKN